MSPQLWWTAAAWPHHAVQQVQQVQPVIPPFAIIGSSAWTRYIALAPCSLSAAAAGAA